MAGLVPTVGEDILLSRALGDVNPTSLDFTLKLFVNDYTPVAGSVAGSFTDMTTQGYAAKTLTAANWTVAQNGSAEAEGTYAQQTWTFDGTGGSTEIFGYFLIDESAIVVWAERFAASYTAVDSGDILRITPIVALYNEIP